MRILCPGGLGFDFRPGSTQTSKSRVIPWTIPNAFPLTNPRQSLLSYTILLVCVTSKPLFFKQSYMSLSAILSFSIPSICPNHRRTPSSIHSSIIYIISSLPTTPYPCIRDLSILLILSKPLRLSICTALILHLSSFHIIIISSSQHLLPSSFLSLNRSFYLIVPPHSLWAISSYSH